MKFNKNSYNSRGFWSDILLEMVAINYKIYERGKFSIEYNKKTLGVFVGANLVVCLVQGLIWKWLNMNLESPHF